MKGVLSESWGKYQVPEKSAMTFDHTVELVADQAQLMQP